MLVSRARAEKRVDSVSCCFAIAPETSSSLWEEETTAARGEAKIEKTKPLAISRHKFASVVSQLRGK